jgi:hypothetical protein
MVDEMTCVGGRVRAFEYYNLKRKLAVDPLQIQRAVIYRTTTSRRTRKRASDIECA